MAGIMDKIGGALHLGGHKEEEKHGEAHKTHEVKHGEAAHHQGEHKEGFADKFKDKITGEHKEGEKKKKEKKKKEGHEHGHHGHDSSSSDSD